MNARRTFLFVHAANLFFALLVFFALNPGRAAEVEIVALVDGNLLLRFGAARPTSSRQIRVNGVEGKLLGIDVRPADGKLYGLTDTNILYTLDPDTGAAVRVSSLSTGFTGGNASGFDFNPSADRLRVVGANRQNLRINVELGATAVDGELTYAPKDLNAGRTPQVTATAYTQSYVGTAKTKTFGIDSALDTLVLQEPPNDGVLSTVGRLGIDCPAGVGFDIYTAPDRSDSAFVACNSTLYSLDLASGRTRKIGTFTRSRQAVLGLAVLPPVPVSLNQP